MRTRGKGLKKEIWFSICSGHYDYDENCKACNKGHWKNALKHRISLGFYNLCPSLWRWWINKK